jgi:hypothetical protein
MEGSGEHTQLAKLKHERSVWLSKLEALEREVFRNRGLLEEEEQVMYCDAIDELDAVYEQVTRVRESQGFKLTPWVCFSKFVGSIRL